MAHFSYDELAEDITNPIRNGGRQVARWGRRAVCFVYRRFPGAVLPNPLGSTLDHLQHSLFDSMCVESEEGLPEPPAPPFEGGQCPNVAYEVFGHQGSEEALNATGNPIYYREFSTSGYGPVSIAVQNGWRGVKFSDKFVELIGENPIQAPVPGQGTKTFNTSVKIDYTSRIDGQPDNCGDVPPQFPAPPYGTPDVFNDNRTINNNDGTDFTIPIIFTPSINVRIPVTVDVGGIEVEFDFDGATINFGDGVDISPILDAIANVDANVNTIGRKLSRDDAQPGDETLTPETPVGGDGGEQDYTDKILEWVKLDVTAHPINAKTQYGNGAPDVYYCGWFSFRSKDSQLPREPIHYLGAIFRAPEGCNGYSYTVYEGFSAIATAYTREKDEQEA